MRGEQTVLCAPGPDWLSLIRHSYRKDELGPCPYDTNGRNEFPSIQPFDFTPRLAKRHRLKALSPIRRAPPRRYQHGCSFSRIAHETVYSGNDIDQEHTCHGGQVEDNYRPHC